MKTVQNNPEFIKLQTKVAELQSKGQLFAEKVTKAQLVASQLKK
jgi:hypothetical protein